MNKKKKEQSKKAAIFSAAVTVLGAIWSLFTLFDTSDRTAIILFVGIIVLCFVIIAVVSRKINKKSADNEEYTLTREDFELKDDEFMLTDEDFADEEGVFTPAEEKRMEQLRGMLKNGIIDRKEYNLLLERYGLK